MDLQNDLLADMAKDSGEAAAAPAPGNALLDEKMGRVASLTRTLLELQEKEEQAKKNLEEAVKRRLYVEQVALPDLFDELGLSNIKLATGEEIKIERGYAATITEQNTAAAFTWLRKNGHSSIIKHNLQVAAKMGEDEVFQSLKEKAEELGLTFEEKEGVHPQTLKSFVNEQKTAGSDIPDSVFGIFPIRKAKVK